MKACFRFVARWMFQLLLWGGILSLAWVSFSCEEFCEEPNRTAVSIHFFDAATGVAVKVKNIGITGIGDKDSVLYPNDKIFGGRDFSQVLLPVNPTADSICFSIRNDESPADTIIIRYTRHNGFISSQCGCATFAEILEESESTHNTIKRMDVVNPKVTTVSYRQGVYNAENIRIYY